MTEPHGGAALTEEIRLLVEMVVERAAPWLDGVIKAGHGGESAHPGSTADNAAEATGERSCGWCPLCAVVAVFRGERPEFAARVLEQAAQLVALLRAVLADRWDPDAGVHMPGFQPPTRQESTASRPESPRVQRIPVRRRPDWQPAPEG